MTNPEPIPPWQAYGVLFKLIERERRIPRECLVELLNADARDKPQCGYSVKSLHNWSAVPKAGTKPVNPRRYRREHLHQFLSKEVAKLPEPEKFADHLKAIEPPGEPLTGDAQVFENPFSKDQLTVSQQHGLPDHAEDLSRKAKLDRVVDAAMSFERLASELFYNTLDVDLLKDAIAAKIGAAKSMSEALGSLLALHSDRAVVLFWERLRTLVEACGFSQSHFNEALSKAGQPPDLPSCHKQSALECAKRIEKMIPRLSEEQRLVWDVAKAAYPTPAGRDPKLKEAARYLAYYWKLSIENAEAKFGANSGFVAAFGKRKASVQCVNMLCWLEMSLVLTVGDSTGAGKLGLFKLARWFSRRASSPSSLT